MNPADSKSEKNHTLRYGLVIQGPLSSTGIAGDGTTVSEFDCLAPIQRTLSRFGHLFEEVVVSTWEGEEPEKLSKIRNLGATVIVSEDEGLDVAPDGGNRLRQYTTALQGLRAIKNPEIFALKIRSDQELDITAFLRDYENYNLAFQDFKTLKRRGPLQGLFFFPSRPLSLCDYALLGPVEDMLQFYSSQLQFPSQSFHEDSGWAEGDSVRKYLYVIRNQLPSIPVSNFFPAFPKDLRSLVFRFTHLQIPEGAIRVWRVAITSVFSVAQESTARTLKWRGRNGLFSTSQVGFREDWMMARLDLASHLCADERALVKNNMPKSWTLNYTDLDNGPKLSAFSRYLRAIRIWTQKAHSYMERLLNPPRA